MTRTSTCLRSPGAKYIWFLLVQTTPSSAKLRILFAVEPRAPTAPSKRLGSSSNPDSSVEYFNAVATTATQSPTHLGGTGTCVTVVNVHQRRVVDVVAAAVASNDCSIRILGIERGTTLAVLGGVAGHAQQVLDLDWFARGDWLVSGAADNAVKFWRVPPAEILARVQGEPVAVAGPARSTQWPHPNFVDGVQNEEGVEEMGEVPRLCAETKRRRQGPTWFPCTLSDLVNFAERVLSYGAELDTDHPGFTDRVYRRARRALITNNAKAYRTGMRVADTANEVTTWGLVYDRLISAYRALAHQANFALLEMHGG
ncbi:hypothetical protein AMAG_20417 [Allomyces macrogynus ATCC 38327]|uniref:phenylalanine 4-monooxygenase n=1 Tax=Allomyces macrogynus (strain ATCC 38327) TaxID=578462 RepID=A0A0L0T8Z5_ALLM3|nr:hypothetical protein AMAG_20417 [Allomyces macrogynus ATCC 38327]|eukprot:KNE71222.1 hypothetical protein AMAG_20417 [Allomyces macrogynus ATCC 38327]